MKLKTLEKSKDNLQVSFEVSGASEGFVNSIRRMVVEEVPTLAVEDVEVRQNSSALFDEMLALRLGLIPIKTDLSSYSLPSSEEDVALRNAKCTLEMELKVNKKGTVYAEAVSSKDPKCTFVYPNMPIVKLHPKQKIDLTALAVVGQGKVHTKWSPGHIWFRNKASVEVKDNAALLEQFKDKFPPQAFDGKGKISVKNIEELNLFDAVDRVCPELVNVSYSDDTFVVDAESFGQLSVIEMLKVAAEMLSEKAKALESQL